MYIKIIGKSISKPLIDIIEACTDQAKLNYGQVQYNDENNQIEIPITRYDFKRRKGLLGMFSPFSYDINNGIKSIVSINNIVSYEKKCMLDPEVHPEITIMFGIRISGNKIYIGSLEEIEGKTCFELELIVSEPNLEIKDVS